MKTELLIIRSDENYIRYKDGSYFPAPFDKASVFPVEKAETVLHHLDRARRAGFGNACIRKLVITEEDWNQ